MGYRLWYNIGMNNQNDFIAEGGPQYQFKIGKYVASSLSGFIAGVIVASIIWFAVVYFTDIAR